MSVDIVIPVLNQIHYTKQCLEGLFTNTATPVQVIVINNGSSDETAEFLGSMPDLVAITNENNLGCAAAWNQGVRAGQAPWVVILNNDVLLPKGWLEGLLSYAVDTGAAIVSPGMRGGACNYDFNTYSSDFMKVMSQASRKGDAHGVCFLVKREVFEKIGLFDENFRIGQYEDTDFFLRAKRAGFSMAITGRSFIHHFGSVTQNMLRDSTSTRPYEAENREYFRKKWHLNGMKRFLLRQKMKIQYNAYAVWEKTRYGFTLG